MSETDSGRQDDGATVDLADLREQPFELLLEMQRRARAAAIRSGGAAGGDWVGLAFRLGEDYFVAPREDLREVLPWPDAMTRMPWAKPWITGLANVRGELLPIVDLKAFLGGSLTQQTPECRLLSLNHRDVPAGIVVDEVLGFRRFAREDRSEETGHPVVRCERYLDGAFKANDRLWPVFGLLRLAESQQFLDAAA